MNENIALLLWVCVLFGFLGGAVLLRRQQQLVGPTGRLWSPAGALATAMAETEINLICSNRILACYKADRLLPYFECTHCGERVSVPADVDFASLRVAIGAHLRAHR
jgi:hypothetical protein